MIIQGLWSLSYLDLEEEVPVLLWQHLLKMVGRCSGVILTDLACSQRELSLLYSDKVVSKKNLKSNILNLISGIIKQPSEQVIVSFLKGKGWKTILNLKS